jgi:hypothetical protein
MSWRVRIGGLFRNARRSGELSHVGRLVPGRAADSSAAFVGADTWLMRDTLQCGEPVPGGSSRIIDTAARAVGVDDFECPTRNDRLVWTLHPL